MPIAYDPAARFDVKEWDTDFRQAPGGRALKARVYQPQGAGPFPVVLDLHGGAWNDKDRFANVPMDCNLAESGILVVAVDMTLATEAPFPAAVQDAHYGVRWLKAHAPAWKGDPATLGVLGSSTGGHMAELVAMRPNDPRYGAHPLPEAPQLDAAVNYVIARSPISDPYVRFQQAEKMKRAEMMQKTRNFFQPWETIHEANPQEMLDRGEAVALPPMFILQGELDDNVIPPIQQKFAASYRKAGGECQLEIFPGCGHMWVAEPGPQTDRAHEMIRAFIKRQLTSLRKAA